ncbi:MAG TPA: prepilin-type N-terminal cleavage/methylation domain-containing protein [Kofleriaceae bacterium]|nr:prepilin-type N-terminal cleavage/methylation domain-containing protein [Kofleriaceae bacterium]
MGRAAAARSTSARRKVLASIECSSTKRRGAPMHARRGSEHGFTMIEVMIAILLSAIAVIGIIGLFVAQGRAAGRSRHETEASALANDKLEKLRTMATPTGSSETMIDVQGVTGNTSSIFERKWTVSSSGGVTTLEVKVGWDDDDVPTQTCATDADCSSKFCKVTTCMSYAVSVYGMRL